VKTTLKGIALLGPHFAGIDRDWNAGLKALARSPRELEALRNLNPRALFETARDTHLNGMKETLLKQGESLAALDVPLEHAITASREYLKLCLKRVPHKDAATRAIALSLVRLSSVSQLYLIAGYTAQRKTRLSALEKSLAEAEERLRGLSRMITDVYDQERRRISRDLHDEVGHDLIVLKLYLEMIGHDLHQKKPAHIAGKLQEAISVVAKAVEKVRQLSYELGPAISDELGFVPALKTYVRQFAKRTGIRVQLRTSNLGSLPSTHEMTLYRVLQGALSNVLRHAGADEVKIALARINATAIMSIEDNGGGFDVQKIVREQPRAFGLTAMKERVELLGGELSIESRRAARRRGKHGTKILVRIPLPVDNRHEQEDQNTALRRSHPVP
jgi:signal transduction histidine kinase